MELFKRLTELLTPPPTKSGAPAKTSPPRIVDPLVEDQGLATAPLGNQVRILVGTESVDDPRAIQAIDDLKKVAQVSGLYVTASKMRIQLDSMHRVDSSSGAVNHRDRGYVLAADFMYQHIMRELKAIEANNRVIGPNIFRSYCNELVACLLQGRNARRGVELPVNIIDALLEAAISTANLRASYMEMAAHAIESTLQQATSKFEIDSRERAKYRHADTPPPSDPDSVFPLNAEMLVYVKDLHDQLARLRQTVTAYEKKPVLKATESGPGVDAERSREHLDYLMGLATIAENAGYDAFTAMLCERIAHASNTLNPAGSLEYARRAAALYESVGDREDALTLSKLSVRRFKRALAIHQALGDQERAGSLSAKLVIR